MRGANKKSFAEARPCRRSEASLAPASQLRASGIVGHALLGPALIDTVTLTPATKGGKPRLIDDRRRGRWPAQGLVRPGLPRNRSSARLRPRQAASRAQLASLPDRGRRVDKPSPDDAHACPQPHPLPC